MKIPHSWCKSQQIFHPHSWCKSQQIFHPHSWCKSQQIFHPHCWCRYFTLTIGADIPPSLFVQIFRPHCWCRYSALTICADIPPSLFVQIFHPHYGADISPSLFVQIFRFYSHGTMELRSDKLIRCGYLELSSAPSFRVSVWVGVAAGDTVISLLLLAFTASRTTVSTSKMVNR